MPKYMGDWHEDLVLQIADILRAALVQAVDGAGDMHFLATPRNQKRLEKWYDGQRGTVIVGLVKDAATRIGMELPGLQITIVESITEGLPAVSLVLDEDLKGEVHE